jgi:uncharacterized FlaG/YvyC family protein
MKKNDIKKGVDDLYTRYAHTLEMLEKAVDKIDQLQEELDKKPKEVIVEKVVEKEIEIIKEIPIEKIVEKSVLLRCQDQSGEWKSLDPKE